MLIRSSRRALSSASASASALAMSSLPASSSGVWPLAAGAPAPPFVPSPDARTQHVPLADLRRYRVVTLGNGLRALLVHDDKADKAAAALSVQVGHLADPRALPGLSHAVEHMLFLGTKTFPHEGEYNAFLKDHGGGSNASTSAEATTYHFQVHHAHLREALARFCSFFVSPLFTESATERELNAVDSEHAKNLQNDGWRGYQLDKATSAPGHPYSRFNVGDSRTLRDEPLARGIDVRRRLLDFHAAHYSASRMTLAVLGSEDVETLAAWATEHFSSIKNNGSAPPAFAGHPHAGRSGVRQLAVPIKDTRALTVGWALPEQKSDWRGKACSYLSHLLGHEGPGSVLSLVKRHGLAEGLNAGISEDESGFACFGVTVELSEAGLARVEDAPELGGRFNGGLAIKHRVAVTRAVERCNRHFLERILGEGKSKAAEAPQRLTEAILELLVELLPSLDPTAELAHGA